MRDELMIDSHKLMYHAPRVARWLEGKDIAPVYVEISPSGGCNHRCRFCAFDYRGYRPRFLESAVLERALRAMGRRGVKSVLFAGEGEPLLHGRIGELARCARESGIDPAVSTNGVLLDEALAQKLIPVLSWIRVSVDAGSAATYSRMHGCPGGDFAAVFSNLRRAVAIRKKTGAPCVIGAQFLVMKENIKEARRCAELVRGSGADYLVFKPYARHPRSVNRLDSVITCKEITALERSLRSVERGNFKAIVRFNAFRNCGEKKAYGHCCAARFWAYIDSAGEIYPCSELLGQRRFSYGNITRDTFDRIFGGRRRARIVGRLENALPIGNCPRACRMDQVNRYLWALKHPPAHVNFI